jgi:ABC-2 type transport system permease protein
MLIMAIGIFGVSYIFAGVTLIFKRVGFFFQIINFAFLGLFWQDRSKLINGSLFAALYDNFPLTMGMTNLQKILINQYVELDFTELHMLQFTANSLLFAFLGYYLFNLMEKKARKLGLLSQY